MGAFGVIADHWGSIVCNHATLHDVAAIGGQSHDVLAVFGHVEKLSAILVNVGTTVVRLSFDCRTMSYDLPTISQTCHLLNNCELLTYA